MTSQKSLNFRLVFLAIFTVLTALPNTFAQQQCPRPNCVKGQLAPQDGGPPCMCTNENIPKGCTVPDCMPNDPNNCTLTICRCTPEASPYCCVNLVCDLVNSTTPSNPTSPPTQYYNSKGGYPYNYNNNCGGTCNCTKDLPPDCHGESVAPQDGGPPCSCNPGFYCVGCTLKPCKAGDRVTWFYLCECNGQFSPKGCLQPRCTP